MDKLKDLSKGLFFITAKASGFFLAIIVLLYLASIVRSMPTEAFNSVQVINWER